MEGIQLTLFGKTSQERSLHIMGEIFERCSGKSQKPIFQCLNLDDGQMPGWFEAAKCTRYTKGEKTMSKCIYKTAEGYCTIHSDGIDIREYCVEGPCDDEEAEESKED